MIKLTFCLTRLPHLSRAQFQDYWINTHGPLVKSVSEVLGIRRYVQMHSLPDEMNAPLQASRGGPASYDGVAQLWYDGLEDLGTRMADPGAREAAALLLEDEKRFVDLPKSPLWWGEEKVVIG